MPGPQSGVTGKQANRGLFFILHHHFSPGGLGMHFNIPVELSLQGNPVVRGLGTQPFPFNVLF